MLLVVVAFRKLDESLRLSLCVLYSMMVLRGRFKTRLKVSRIRLEVLRSWAVLFQTQMMSSWNRMEMTAPQISSPTINCSPRMAKIRFSQHLETNPFLSLTIHLPPSLLASSCRPIVYNISNGHNQACYTDLPHGFDSILEEMVVSIG